MTRYAEFELKDGGRLVVEDAHRAPRGEEPMGISWDSATLTKAQESLSECLDTFVPAVEEISSRLRTLAPHQMSIEMTASFSAELGLALVKGGSEGHLKITMNWDQGTKSD